MRAAGQEHGVQGKQCDMARSGHGPPETGEAKASSRSLHPGTARGTALVLHRSLKPRTDESSFLHSPDRACVTRDRHDQAAYRVAMKLPRTRFVACNVAITALRKGSSSARWQPSRRCRSPLRRKETLTIATVASKTRSVFTPS